eukprot:461780_1
MVIQNTNQVAWIIVFCGGCFILCMCCTIGLIHNAFCKDDAENEVDIYGLSGVVNNAPPQALDRYVKSFALVGSVVYLLGVASIIIAEFTVDSVDDAVGFFGFRYVPVTLFCGIGNVSVYLLFVRRIYVIFAQNESALQPSRFVFNYFYLLTILYFLTIIMYIVNNLLGAYDSNYDASTIYEIGAVLLMIFDIALSLSLLILFIKKITRVVTALDDDVRESLAQAYDPGRKKHFETNRLLFVITKQTICSTVGTLSYDLFCIYVFCSYLYFQNHSFGDRQSYNIHLGTISWLSINAAIGTCAIYLSFSFSNNLYLNMCCCCIRCALSCTKYFTGMTVKVLCCFR